MLQRADLARFWSFLHPGAAEQDEGFRAEIDRLSIQSLRIIGGVEVVVPIFMLAVQRVAAPNTVL